MIAFLLAQTIAITGGTVYPVSGPKLEHATVLIQNGRVVAVGPNVTIPADATRIDATGKWVTPGFIDGGTQMGLVEIGRVGEPTKVIDLVSVLQRSLEQSGAAKKKSSGKHAAHANHRQKKAA